MKNGLIAYFGYGSLVNRETLRTDFVSCRPARLHGWHRRWQSRGSDIAPAGGEEIALLSATPHAPGSILGMLVIDRAEHLGAVDEREARYDRVRIGPEIIELVDETGGALPDDLYLYVGKARPDPPEPPKLLQSYLDAVMAGYLREFGETGVDHFLETTFGFARSVIRDRDAPRYSRSVTLDEADARRFDSQLASVGVRFE